MRIWNLLLGFSAILLGITATHAQTVVTFNEATLGGTGDLGVSTITLADIDGTGVDITLSGSVGFPFDDPANASNIGHAVNEGDIATGENIDQIGVVATGQIQGTQQTERLNVRFNEEVLVSQIVLVAIGRGDDQMTFGGMADNFDFSQTDTGEIELSFDTLGTEEILGIATFQLDTESPIINANADTGDGDGLDVSVNPDIENFFAFTFALVVNFDTPVNTDGFLFSADLSGGAAGGVGINSITFEAGSTAPLLGDVNLDGVVDLLDVGPFVALLTNGEFLAEADINGDGLVDLLDVGPFVDLLSG